VPIDRRLDPSTNVLRTTIWGLISIHELRQILDAARETDSHRYCEVIDARAAEPLVNVRDLAGLASHGRTLYDGLTMAPRAVVVKQNDLFVFGVARLFSTLAAPWITLRVFDNLEAAVDYITAITSSRN